MELPRVHTYDLSGVFADEASLSGPERVHLATLCLEGRRRREWILGRIAVRRALSINFPGNRLDVLSTPEGAPCILGNREVSVSLSHDSSFIAVALMEGRVKLGVDLCLKAHSQRLHSIVRRSLVEIPNVELSLLWASLEAVLKMHRRGVSMLLDWKPCMEVCETDIVVTKGENSVRVFYKEYPEYFVAWCSSEETCTS